MIDVQNDRIQPEASKVEFTDLQPEARELSAEEAEKVNGGIIAVLIGLKQQTALPAVRGNIGFCDGSV